MKDLRRVLRVGVVADVDGPTVDELAMDDVGDLAAVVEEEAEEVERRAEATFS